MLVYDLMVVVSCFILLQELKFSNDSRTGSMKMAVMFNETYIVSMDVIAEMFNDYIFTDDFTISFWFKPAGKFNG